MKKKNRLGRIGGVRQPIKVPKDELGNIDPSFAKAYMDFAMGPLQHKLINKNNFARKFSVWRSKIGGFIQGS